jgi:tartrate dehydrogenase/decarboxylase/D-malate dehydrogenase
MSEFHIAVVGGDGIGPEVISSAQQVLERAIKGEPTRLHFHPLPWSAAYYQQHGRIMPADGWEILQKHQAIFLGAMGHPQVPDSVTIHGLLLPMRRKFDQFVNLRPSYLFPGVPCPLKDKAPGSIDMVVFRENTEGEYAPVGGRLYQGTPDEVAIQTAVFTRRGCDRIMRAAFDMARTRRKKVTSISKSNALPYGFVMWDEAFAAVTKDYPDVQTHSLLVDAAAMDFVRKPETFDVVVASNLFGDILTDLAAIVTGSMGLAASANIDPTRKHPSMFEPVHGSAPDIAGQGIANPLAAILSGVMMLEFLGLDQAAARVKGAVAKVLATGTALTPDLGGKSKTKDVTEAVLAAL